MNRAETLHNFPLIDSVRNKREQLKLTSLDIDLLRLQAASVDVSVASVSKRLLRTKWDLSPELDSSRAVSIDIKEQLAPFSSSELRVIFKNLVSIQLTEGCNGNCPFCMLGVKYGVTAKYSFESIRTLFEEYSEEMSDNPFLLYWDSDPFDYRDDDKSFFDVYKLYRQTWPNYSQYISTAIPRGGESDFIAFMVSLASDFYDGTDTYVSPVRISISQHNIQRVEATLLALSNQLLESGYTQRDINNFYNNTILTVGRFDNFLLPLGPYIKKADDIKDTYSTACRDGVVISPISCQAIMMTAATVYEPSGQKSMELLPGQVTSFVPVKMREEHYAKFIFGETSILLRTQLKQTMLPLIKQDNGSEYSLQNAFDDAILKLGREVASLTRLISNLSRIADLPICTPNIKEEKDVFTQVSIQVFRERQAYTEVLIESAERLQKDNSLSDEERKQIQYYVLLAQTHLAKMNFLANQVELGRPISTLSKMASVLADVGRDDLERLPLIFNELSILEDE